MKLTSTRIGGHPRPSVRALLVGNNYLVNEIDQLAETVSAGFTRRRIQRPISNEALRIVANSETEDKLAA